VGGGPDSPGLLMVLARRQDPKEGLTKLRRLSSGGHRAARRSVGRRNHVVFEVRQRRRRGGLLLRDGRGPQLDLLPPADELLDVRHRGSIERVWCKELVQQLDFKIRQTRIQAPCPGGDAFVGLLRLCVAERKLSGQHSVQTTAEREDIDLGAIVFLVVQDFGRSVVQGTTWASLHSLQAPRSCVAPVAQKHVSFSIQEHIF